MDAASTRRRDARATQAQRFHWPYAAPSRGSRFLTSAPAGSTSLSEKSRQFTRERLLEKAMKPVCDWSVRLILLLALAGVCLVASGCGPI